MAINLRRIEVFQAIYAMGGVSAAARLLNISQPSVSRMLHYFESDLGVKLFQLSKGKLRPTPEADRLYAETVPIFNQLKLLEKFAEQLQGGEQELVRVSCSSSLALSVLPDVIADFSGQYEYAPMIIDSKNYSDTIRDLGAGEIDIGIVINQVSIPGFDTQTLGEGHLVCLVPSEHPLAKRQQICLKDFEKWPSILGPETSPLGSILSAALSQHGIKPKRLITTRSPLMSGELVSKGIGIAVCDIFSAAQAEGKNVVVKALDVRMNFSIQAVHPATKVLSGSERIFVEFFRSRLNRFLVNAQ